LGEVSTSVPAGSWDPSPVSYGDRYPGLNMPIEQTVRVPGSRQVKGEATNGIS